MATRPVFVPDTDPDQPQLVHVHEIDFQWLPGRSQEQKKENIAKLHAAAKSHNLSPLLEVSADSDHSLGYQVCDANLAVEDDRSYLVPLMAAYHGSKVFNGGGPFTDLYLKHGDDITGDERLKTSGNQIGFRFMGLEWGKRSETLFYDWLTIHAINRYRKLSTGIPHFNGFTEIDCPSGGEKVCHARSCAYYVALVAKNLLDEVLDDQDRFLEIMILDSFYQPRVEK